MSFPLQDHRSEGPCLNLKQKGNWRTHRHKRNKQEQEEEEEEEEEMRELAIFTKNSGLRGYHWKQELRTRMHTEYENRNRIQFYMWA